MRKTFSTAEAQVWFTADLHFGHHGMVKHGRPWTDVNEMDQALIRNWHSCVGDRDHIFVLGDFSFRKRDETLHILARLNGIKYLIRGNHDKGLKNIELSFFEGGVADYHEIDVDGQRIILSHYAFRSWNKMHYGSWNLHGHSHGNLTRQGKQLDVGVDAVGLKSVPELYAPISFTAVSAILKTAPFVAVDHHTPKPE